MSDLTGKEASHYYRVYGKLEDFYIGAVQPKNIDIDDEEGALNACREAVKKNYNAEVTHAIRSEHTKEITPKAKYEEASFFYKDDYFEPVNIGVGPGIRIITSSEDESDTRMALGFNDLETVENFMEALNKVRMHFKNEKEKTNEHNG